jgi:hypothetical protein
MLLPEEQVWGRRPAMPSSETEARSRGRLALNRDGASREGASSPQARRSPTRGSSDPQARRNLTQGGDQPTSEVDLYRDSTVPLERRGALREGSWADCLTGRGSAGSFRARV